jgi:hypothetical protein
MLSVPFATRFPGRSGGLVLLALLSVNLCLRCIVALRPLEYIDGLIIPDDAYLSLTIARNIAAGLGPLYGLEHTNGFQPLYVFLMVPVYWILHHDLVTPVHIALILLSLFDTATLLLLFRLVAAQSMSFITPLVTAALWILNPYVVSTTLNGLETAISCFFIAAVFLYYAVYYRGNSERGVGNDFVLGLLLGCAVFARIDNLLLAASAGIIIVLTKARQQHGLSSSLRSLTLIGTGVFLVNLPWLLYSFHYTGDLYPVSGRAVRFMSLANVQHQPTLNNWYLLMMERAIRAITVRNTPLLVLVAVLGLTAFALRKRARGAFSLQARMLSLPFFFILLLILSYTFYIFTPWFFERYFYPVSLVLLLLSSALIDGIHSTMRSPAGRRFLAIALFVGVGATTFASREFSDLFLSRQTNNLGYMNAGLWARRSLPAGTILGSSQTGGLGYFADSLVVINLDGVVNKSCYESLVKRQNMEYIRKMKVEYVMGWPVNIRFIVDHSAGFKEGDLVLVKKIEDFRSWESDWYLLKVRY